MSEIRNPEESKILGRVEVCSVVVNSKLFICSF